MVDTADRIRRRLYFLAAVLFATILAIAMTDWPWFHRSDHMALNPRILGRVAILVFLFGLGASVVLGESSQQTHRRARALLTVFSFALFAISAPLILAYSLSKIAPWKADWQHVSTVGGFFLAVILWVLMFGICFVRRRTGEQ